MLWTDFSHLLSAVLVVVGAVLPVVNPPGDAPIFLRMTVRLRQLQPGPS